MKILELLGLSKTDKDKKAQERIGRQLKRGQEKLIDDLDAKRDALVTKKEKLESITADTAQSQIDSWNNDYHKILVDLKLIDKEISIAKETLEEMFSDDVKSTK